MLISRGMDVYNLTKCVHHEERQLLKNSLLIFSLFMSVLPASVSV